MADDSVAKDRRVKGVGIALLFILPCLFYALWHFSSPMYYETGTYGITEISTSPDGQFIAKALISDSAQKRAKGLMGKVINETGGMLFVFETPGKYVFTMRDMKISIDILFIDKAKKLVDLETNVPPMSPDPSTWGSRHPDFDCLYVLELKAGRASSLGLSEGTVLNFTL